MGKTDVRLLQIRFELDKVDDELFAGDGLFVAEGDDLCGGRGPKNNPIEIDLGDVVVVFVAAGVAPVDVDESLVTEDVGTFQFRI